MPGSIRERRPGVWTVRVDAAPNPRTGKRVQIAETVYGTKRQAQMRQAEMAAKYHGRLVRAGSMTLDELFARWITAPTRGGNPRAASTLYQERRRYERHVSPSLGARDITTIRPAEITALYDSLAVDTSVDGKTKSKISAKSIRRVHEQLRAMFSWARKRDFISENPAEKADCPTTSLSPPSAPSLRAVEAFLTHLEREDNELWLAIRLTATLALRRSELVGLRWSDVDFSAGRISVTRGVLRIPKLDLVETSTKTGAAAAVSFAVDAALLDALAAYREHCESLATEVGGRLADDGFIFSGDVNGEAPWHPDTLTSRVHREQRKVKAAAGITLKSLRAFVATELEAEGEDITTAQAVLRHRTSTTTARYYRAARQERVREATQTLGARLGKRAG
jgi:integrase